MPKKRNAHTQHKALEVALHMLPFLLPVALWLALQGQFPTYHPTVADVIALASGFIVLLVFIVQHHLKISSLSTRWKDSQAEIDRLREDIRRLRVQPSEPRQSPDTLTPRKANLPPGKPKGIFDEYPPSNPPVRDRAPTIKESIPTDPPQAPEITEEEILMILNSRFSEYARLSESNAERLTTTLNAELSESKNRPTITVIYRDGAVESSQIYRLQREDVQIPNPGIVVIFPSGGTRLFPAPMAGQDCFHDVKAFESSTPGPSQKRSGLTHCESASLDRKNDTTFQLRQFGRLDFRF